jgi:hypothetical protein
MGPFLDEWQAADYLGIDSDRFDELRREGTGPKGHVHPSGDVVYRREDLDNWATQGKAIVTVRDRTNVMAFPGVKVRVERRKLRKLGRGRG